MDNYYQISPIVESIIKQEAPVSILEISGYNCCYGKLFADCQKHTGKKAYVDRVVMTDDVNLLKNHIYRNVYSFDIFNDADKMQKYDIIFITHLLENTSPEYSIDLLEKLQHKVYKQILIITPEYPYDPDMHSEKLGVREYHPIAFLGLDYSYWMFNSDEGNWQFYSIFAKNDYPAMEIDILTERIQASEPKKLRIAYVLPHRGLTGGTKALLHQVKQLTRRGHVVKVYLHDDEADEVIPDWSELTYEDFAEQIVVPLSSPLLRHIDNVDIIILGWSQQALHFADATIPVVLWEQGSEWIFGDYGSLLLSSATESQMLRTFYRAPVHILAVSKTIVKVLKGKYNRDAGLFPACIDTDLYFPAPKNNEMPVVLLVGNPQITFKGFDLALTVLEVVWGMGVRFTVQWACQSMPQKYDTSFKIEYFERIPQEQLALLYRQADVFLSTSLYESFALTPIEAMASGTAVVSTDNGGIWMYADPGINCLLAEQGDIESLAVAVAFLLQNPQQRDAIASAGRETAMMYSFQRVTDCLEESLQRIVKSHKRNDNNDR